MYTLLKRYYQMPANSMNNPETFTLNFDTRSQNSNLGIDFPNTNPLQ